ncbi:hypothetical protein D3C86_1782950 [compost metagenome]
MHAQFAPRQAVGEAAPVHAFVMVDADIERDVRIEPGLVQDAVASRRVPAVDLLFLGRAFAGLVHRSIGQRQLADVVDQAGQAELAHLVVGQAQRAADGDHQRADGEGVQVVFVATRLEPRQRQQRLPMARQRA